MMTKAFKNQDMQKCLIESTLISMARYLINLCVHDIQALSFSATSLRNVLSVPCLLQLSISVHIRFYTEHQHVIYAFDLSEPIIHQILSTSLDLHDITAILALVLNSQCNHVRYLQGERYMTFLNQSITGIYWHLHNM